MKLSLAVLALISNTSAVRLNSMTTTSASVVQEEEKKDGPMPPAANSTIPAAGPTPEMIMATFQDADLDGNQGISFDEFKKYIMEGMYGKEVVALAIMGEHGEDILHDIFSKYDTNGNACVTFAEVMGAPEIPHGPCSQHWANVTNKFLEIDADGDGLLTWEEVLPELQKEGWVRDPPRRRDIKKYHDKLFMRLSTDGKHVKLNEFLAFFAPHTPEQHAAQILAMMDWSMHEEDLGKLCQDEINSAVKWQKNQFGLNITQEDADHFNEFDVDQDGCLDMDELIEAFRARDMADNNPGASASMPSTAFQEGGYYGGADE